MARNPGDGRLPTFLIIGAMKAGTTTLFEHLRAHPDVAMPAAKELEFFVAERNWGLGVDWYRSCFTGADAAVAVGEASPVYSMLPWFTGVPERIAAVLPDVHVVYLVRHPIERMRSHYLHAVAEGRERRTLGDAFASDDSYLEVSRYTTQLDAYAAQLGPARILVLTTDDLRDRRDATVGRVLSFIGVDPARARTDRDRWDHRSDAKVGPRPWARRVQQTPGYYAVGRVVPAAVRRTWGRLTTGPLDPRRERLPAALDQEIRGRLAPEVAGLRRWLGPGFHGWGIA